MHSTYSGFLSFDAMLTFMPILLMAVYTISYANFLGEKNQNEMRAQILHDKLVSISELVVNDLAAEKTSWQEQMANSVKPNWIDEDELANVDRDGLASSIGLVKLEIGWQPGTAGNCIYRLVVAGKQKEIKQLFICGE